MGDVVTFAKRPTEVVFDTCPEGQEPMSSSNYPLDTGGRLKLLYSNADDWIVCDGMLHLCDLIKVYPSWNDLPLDPAPFEFDFNGRHWKIGTHGDDRYVAFQQSDGSVFASRFFRPPPDLLTPAA